MRHPLICFGELVYKTVPVLKIRKFGLERMSEKLIASELLSLYTIK